MPEMLTVTSAIMGAGLGAGIGVEGLGIDIAGAMAASLGAGMAAGLVIQRSFCCMRCCCCWVAIAVFPA